MREQRMHRRGPRTHRPAHRLPNPDCPTNVPARQPLLGFFAYIHTQSPDPAARSIGPLAGHRVASDRSIGVHLPVCQVPLAKAL